MAESWFLCGEAVFPSGPGDEGRRPLLPPGPDQQGAEYLRQESFKVDFSRDHEKQIGIGSKQWI